MGVSIVFKSLTADQLAKLRTLETELGAVLVAYEPADGALAPSGS